MFSYEHNLFEKHFVHRRSRFLHGKISIYDKMINCFSLSRGVEKQRPDDGLIPFCYAAMCGTGARKAIASRYGFELFLS